MACQGIGDDRRRVQMESRPPRGANGLGVNPFLLFCFPKVFRPCGRKYKACLFVFSIWQITPGKGIFRGGKWCHSAHTPIPAVCLYFCSCLSLLWWPSDCALMDIITLKCHCMRWAGLDGSEPQSKKCPAHSQLGCLTCPLAWISMFR